MTSQRLRLLCIPLTAALVACGGVTDVSTDASIDGVDAGLELVDAGSEPIDAGDEPDAAESDASPDSGPEQICTPNESLRCESGDLVVCSDDGTEEEEIACVLGCEDSALRCRDVEPSNGLADFLDQAGAQPLADFGESATINTDTEQVEVNGSPVALATFVTGSEPEILVIAVGGLVADDVTVSGARALAIVSDGDIELAGHFSVSASGATGGPGAFDEPACTGQVGERVDSNGATSLAGGGGGGFGSSGARGGIAIAQDDAGEDVRAEGGPGGGTTGNAQLVPLRGGCSGSGEANGTLTAGGGGAVQLVSRTTIQVDGIVAASGAGGRSTGAGSAGGSGGGILLEAPEIVITGNVVANGGGGGASGICTNDAAAGEDGRTDNQRAAGGTACGGSLSVGGGLGAAGSQNALFGSTNNSGTVGAFGGHGGAGVGRIRINTAAGGLTAPGLFSPAPSTGVIGSR
jgi:hypothetical protein